MKALLISMIAGGFLALAGIGGGGEGVAFATKTPGDFNLGHRFTVEIDGAIISGIDKVTGLESETDVHDYKDGEDATTIRLVREWTGDPYFFEWRKAVLDGKTDRRSVSIIFHNDAGGVSARVNLFDCYPTKWKGPALNAKNSAHATESLDLSCTSK